MQAELMISLLQQHLSQKTSLSEKNEQASQTVAKEAPRWLTKIRQENARKKVRFMIPPSEPPISIPSKSFWETLISLPSRVFSFLFPQEEDYQETAGLFDFLGDIIHRYVRLEKMFALILFTCEVLQLPSLKKFTLFVQRTLSDFFSWLHVCVLLFDPSVKQQQPTNDRSFSPYSNEPYSGTYSTGPYSSPYGTRF